MNELSTQLVTREVIIGKDTFGITEEEFQKIHEFIQAKKTGLIYLKRVDDYINLSLVSMIRHKKSSEPKVFGEDIAL